MFTAMLEIPPRARRRVEHAQPEIFHRGNTSACAEKRFISTQETALTWKYLRVRGEEIAGVLLLGILAEIPPRARRREALILFATRLLGNTSACAEKRCPKHQPCWSQWKYLRVRGEEAPARISDTRAAEIPPRARRRADAGTCRCGDGGNTSACAEKRHVPAPRNSQGWKYLRVRGEEARACTAEFSRVEIPPRARRRAFFGSVCSDMKGNTSACAEKSSVMPGRKVSNWKYLRVRGEEISIHAVLIATLEIPPRARRREPAGWCFDGGYGNTSACAEKSDSRSRQPLRPQKYLRVRGEEPGLAP